MSTTSEATTTTVSLHHDRCERVEIAGIEILSGYLWHVAPNGDTDLVDDDGDSLDVGYHGTAMPPASAEWIADEDEDGYVVITRDATRPVCVAGWECEPLRDVEVGHVWADGAGTTVVAAIDTRDRDDDGNVVTSGVVAMRY